MAIPTERFVLDVMLGKLTTYLRMMGYDTAYALDRGVEADGAILELAEAEDRRIVTRDRQLATQSEDAILLAGHSIEDQLAELQAAGITLELTEPCRCATCNSPLDRLPAKASTAADAPDPSERSVWRCRRCGQAFWKGSHWDDVDTRLERARTSRINDVCE